MQLDLYDKAILDLLQQNALISYKEISQKINLSPTAVYERVKQLEKENIIAGYKTLLNRKKIDLSVMAFCFITLKENTENLEEFTAAISGFNEVAEFYDVAGDLDYILKIYVKDMEHFQAFYSTKLVKVANILRITSVFVNIEIKNTIALPVG